MRALLRRLYPEIRAGGFSRVDGTVLFYLRVRALLRPDDVVLDVGCGRGAWGEDPLPFRRDLRVLRGRCRRVIGIDPDPAAARNPWIDEFRPLGADRWPAEDGSADLAVADFVVEHLADPDAFLAEARRVLRPGGWLCLRTPNARSYVVLAARLVPERLHASLLRRAQPDRKEEDVFPKHYRCNTPGRLRRALRGADFDPVVLTVEPEPAYLGFSPAAFAIGALAHRFMPPPLRSTILAWARRGDGGGE